VKPDRTRRGQVDRETSGLTCNDGVDAGDLGPERKPDANPEATLSAHITPPSHRHRELAAHQETGLLPVAGNQIRLGQHLEQPLCLESLHECRQVQIRPEGEDVQRVADRELTLGF
jgi:hypothetical protein